MRRVPIVIAALALLATACGETAAPEWTTTSPETSATTSRPETITPWEGGPIKAVPAAHSLRSLDACEDFLAYAKEHALERVGAWGLDGYAYPMMEGDVVFAEEAAPAATDGFRGPEGGRLRADQPDVDYSTTNVQEIGVDEPDIIKTDGSRILAVGGGYLHYVDLSDGFPRLTDSLALDRGWGHQLVMAGDRLLVLSTGDRYGVAPRMAPNVWTEDLSLPYVEVTLISEVDISDPDHLRVVRDLYLDGNYVTARLVDDTVRVVIRSQPTGLEFEYPRGSGLRAEREAAEHNRRVIEESSEENWLPYYVLESRERGRLQVSEGTLVECTDVHVPEEFSGLGMTSIVTIDLADGLRPGPSAAIFSQGETVYASADSLYIATNQWWDPWVLAEEERLRRAERWTTEIHRFDISDPDDVEYRASGAVPGYLLNQWAMSEHDGYVRVASTDAGTFWGFGPERASESFVTVLAERDGELVTVGQVDDLGRGERIYAVRYIGNIGFVVTFRQIDPLYTLDLSDPRRPEVLGELKIPGYSAYLHPVGDDLLLGVGQDATLGGRQLGAQVSLFDISDLKDPERIDRITFGNGNSEVEYDHHAFLFWARAGLAMIPVQQWSWDEFKGTEEWFAGVVAVRIDPADGLDEMGTITHRPDDDYYDWYDQVRRSLVVDEVIYTMSEQGLKANALEDLDELAWIPFF